MILAASVERFSSPNRTMILVFQPIDSFTHWVSTPRGRLHVAHFDQQTTLFKLTNLASFVSNETILLAPRWQPQRCTDASRTL